MDIEPCMHEQTEIRRKVFSDGRKHLVRQCMTCGSNRGAVSSKATLHLAEIKPFDDALVEAQRARWSNAVAQRDAAWWARYEAHLKSPEWQRLRVLVMMRARGKCEGCGKPNPVQVHHETYDHLGNELLWELKAVCRDCHQRLHPHREL